MVDYAEHGRCTEHGRSTEQVVPPSISINAAFDALSAKREYKVFSVLKNSGEAVSMRILELAAT